MNQQIAIRSDGAIAVATSIVDGWAHGYLIDANGERFEWPSPLASLLGQGSWKPIDGFDLSTITPPSEFSDAISKAYKRKYANRSEAARAAARARWGNRSTYNQQAQVSPRSQPLAVEMLYPWKERQDKDFVPATIIDTVITESVEPFDEDAFVKMAEMGPVSLVGVHATERRTPDLPFTGEPQGGGVLGQGVYASLINRWGIYAQENLYQDRGRQALVRLEMNKPMVVTNAVEKATRQKLTEIDGGYTFGNILNQAVFAHLMKNESDPKALLQKYEAIKTKESRGSWDTGPESPVAYLKSQGFDGIVYTAERSGQVSVFSSEQIRAIDPVLSADERKLVYETGNKVAKAVGHAFDGRGFDLVSIEELENPSIAKAYKRKYGSRTEAARAAANARWGNRSEYSQGAVTSKRPNPVQAEVIGKPDTILDKVLTESVDPFDADAFMEAVEKGPVSLIGVHATYAHGMETSVVFGDEPRGGGFLGPGTYSSLIDEYGIAEQEKGYEFRGRQVLLRVSLKKPVVLDHQDFIGTEAGTYNDGLEAAVAKVLQKKGLSEKNSPRWFDAFAKDYPQAKSVSNDAYPDYTPVLMDYLKKNGHDGIVLLGSSGSMVSVFSGKQIKVIDPVLTSEERRLVYAAGRSTAAGSEVAKATDHAFDGRGFDLVSIEDLMTEPITKMSRSEAGRYAANVRWGNRTPAVASIDAVSLSRGQQITIEGKQLGNLTINMVDTGIDGDLRNVHIPGYALFDGANMGLRREQMPQVPARNKPKFLSEMRLQGVGVAAQSVDPRILKPSQADISASKTGAILKKMRDGSFHDSPAGRILVSKDGFVIDGHHRWAAAAAYAFDVPGARLPIIRVDMNAADLIPAAREFGAREGIKTLGFGETLKKAARWLFGS